MAGKKLDSGTRMLCQQIGAEVIRLGNKELSTGEVHSC